MPKRMLAKDLHRARQALGISGARGETFSPLRGGKQLIEMIQEIALKAIKAQ
jgi:hypothetical protein